jgi:hypothetical protein
MTFALVPLCLTASLLTAAVSASPPPASTPPAVVVVARDPGSEALVPSFSEALTGGVKKVRGGVRGMEVLFPKPAAAPDDSLRAAQAKLDDGQRALGKRQFKEAQSKAAAALSELKRSAGALSVITPLCRALALNAAAALAQGQTAVARTSLMDLLALDAEYTLDAKQYDAKLISLRSELLKRRASQLLASAHIQSKPEGAQVFWDGELKGLTPANLGGFAPGMHWVRIERTGFTPYATIVSVQQEGFELAPTLEPLPSFREAQSEALKGGAGLAQRLGSEVWLGQLSARSDSGVWLELAWLDPRGQSVARHKALLQDVDLANLASEMERWVRNLAGKPGAGAASNSTAKDPLERKQGTEDWNTSDRAAGKAKKKSDPLEGVSGTEDW